MDTMDSFPVGRREACESTGMNGSGWRHIVSHYENHSRPPSLVPSPLGTVCSASLPGKSSLSELCLLEKCAAGYLGNGHFLYQPLQSREHWRGLWECEDLWAALGGV